MGRPGDSGPYAVGNVMIIPASENVSTRKKSGLPIGVSHDKRHKSRPYRACRFLNGKQVSLGSFVTPEEAHAAYLAAGTRMTSLPHSSMKPHEQRHSQHGAPEHEQSQST